MSVQIVDVWGDYACFSRPESKVERFSYPVINPSAARGVLDAIYSKNIEFYWQVCRIDILRPIKFIAIKRNEIKDKISENAVKKAMNGGGLAPIVVDATKESSGTDMTGRTQRQTVALRDVKYRIYAQIVPRSGFESRLPALEAQFARRVDSGKCFYQPYFGQREFVAYFSAAGNEPPHCIDQNIGLMVYDVFDLKDCTTDTAKPYITLFDASISAGTLEIPPFQDQRVLKPRKGVTTNASSS